MDVLLVQVTATVLAVILVSTGLAVLAWPALSRMRLPRIVLASRFAALRYPEHGAGVKPVVSAALPERLSRDVQWDRASDVITQSIARIATVHELQRSAEQQIDAATYAIQRLFDELSSIMTVQPGAPVHEAATGQVVHPFTPAAPRRDAAEAIAA